MVDEEQKGEETKPTQESPTADAGEGNKPATTGYVERAELAAQKLDETLKKINEANQRIENNLARAMLGGRTDAGQVPVEKEETPAEYAKRIAAGKL